MGGEGGEVETKRGEGIKGGKGGKRGELGEEREKEKRWQVPNRSLSHLKT